MRDVPGAGEQAGWTIGEISRVRLDRGRAILAAFTERVRSVPGCEGESGQLSADRPSLAAWIGELSDEDKRCLLFAAVAGLNGNWRYCTVESTSVDVLSTLPIRYDAGDVRLLARLTQPGTGYEATLPLSLIMRLTRELVHAGAPGAAALADELAEITLAWNPLYRSDHFCAPGPDVPVGYVGPPDTLSEYRDEALELAMRPPVPPEAEGPVSRDDGFGRAVIMALGPVEDWPPGLAGFLAHCATARASKPSARWQRQCTWLLSAVPDGPAAWLVGWVPVRQARRWGLGDRPARLPGRGNPGVPAGHTLV